MPHKPGFIHSGKDETSWNYFELPFGSGADYKKPIPLEDLPYTPAELGEMLENKEKEREIEIEGLGKGRLVIHKQNKNKPFFYRDQSKEYIEKKSRQLQIGEIVGNLPIITSPLTSLGTGVPRIIQSKTKQKIDYAKMYAKETKDLNKNAINLKKGIDNAYNMPTQQSASYYKRAANVAKKNHISLSDAFKYLDSIQKGVRPDKPIKPGNITGITNKGLLKDTDVDDPTVYIPPEERLGTQKGDPLQMKVDHSINPEQPIEPGDIPKIDLSTMIEPMRGKTPDVNILSVLNQNGMRGGRLDMFAYRRAGKDRKAVEYYISPYSKMVKFNPVRDKILAAMNKKYGGLQDVLGLGEKRSFQAHHKVPIKASFPAFHGIVKESPKYEYYMGLYANAILSLGNQIENIVPAIGAVSRDFDAPHHLVHQFNEVVMGAAGEKFWDDTTLESLVVRNKNGEIIGTRNDEMRERLILKQIELFKRGEDIIKLGMEEYGLYATNTTVPPEQIVDYFISNYGTPNLPADLKYQPEIIKKLTRDAIQDFENTHVPSIVGGTLDLETLQYLQELADRPPNWWRSLNIQQKKAQMPSITETVKGTANGYTFEQLDSLVYHGWITQETLDKLFNPPKFESIEDIINDVFPDD